MQALLASLVFSMSVKDEAFKAGMAQARVEAKKTDQDFERSGKGMAASIQHAARVVDQAAVGIVDSLANVGRQVRNAGLALTVGLTVPLGLIGKGAKDTASDFQSAMGKVNAAMVNASPAQIEKLRAAALELGPAFGKSAIDAAGAIESLAKNGMSAADILSGGLTSALKLAIVGETDLGSAADATTDIIAQFGKSASDLPRIVDRVTGALGESKLSMDDYRLALGQAGGTTGNLGYSFEDLNVALAATASSFEGGSQAATSFRSFLTSLAGKSEASVRTMNQLGLSFYKANGSARGLTDIAEQLRTKLGQLNDESLQDAVNNMFGTDGGQTALALMSEGAEGIEKMRAAIDKVTADEKMKILLDGEAHATQRLASAWERLGIAIGDAGLIQVMTAIKQATASVIETIAKAPPALFYMVVALGAVAGSIGPVILGLAAIVGAAAPFLVGMTRLGVAARVLIGALGTLVNPIGMVGRMLAQMAIAAGGAMIIGRLGTAMLGLAGPIGLAITALTILVPWITRAGQASDAAREAVEQGRDAEMKAVDAKNQLATATGKLRVQLLAKAKADQVAAHAAMRAAQADMQAARATYERAKANSATKPRLAAATVVSTALIAGGLDPANAIGNSEQLRNRQVADATADFQTRIDALDGRIKTLAAWNAAVSAPAPAAKIDMNFADPAKTKPSKGRDRSQDESNYLDELGRSRVAQLQAQAEETQGIQARYRAEMTELDEERASYQRGLAADEGLTAARRATLLAEKDKELVIRRGIAEDTRFDADAQRDYDLARATNDAQQDILRATLDLADNLSDRRVGELRLIALQRRQEEADLELILATKATSSAEWQNAADRKRDLDGVYAAKRVDAVRRTETPVESYMRTLNRSATAISEDVQSIGVSALQDMNSQLTDAVMNAKSLGDAFANMGKRIIASLIDIAIQQAVIKPLANALFGAADADGNRSGGSLTSLAASIGRAFGGGKALGGPVSASEWYVVGERGPEVFAPGVSGTIIPNGGRGAGPASGGIATIVPSPYFDVVVDRRVVRGAGPIAEASTGRGIGSVQRANALRGRQALA
jgi:TP901 family phage tail tape measure protein